MAIFALHCLTMSAQQIKISGKVTDESNYPLPGATVSILESGNGTSTNLEGEYPFKSCREPNFNSVISVMYPKQYSWIIKRY